MIDYNKQLNDEQYKICTSFDNMLVKACPGSGKTRTLIYKLCYHLENDKMKHRKLIAMTFTNRAAEEIQDRLDKLIDKSDRIWTGTIHQFCIEFILNRFKMYSKPISRGYKIIDERVKENYLNLILKNNNSRFTFWDINTAFDRNFNLIETNPHIVKIINEYYEVLEKNRELDFDMLLLKTYQLLKDNSNICLQIKDIISLVCVDEYQDTNDLQYAIIEEIMNAKSQLEPQVVFLGDPNQAIYDSLGGVVKKLEQLNDEFKYNVFNNYTIQGCYRTNQRLIDYYKHYMVDEYNITAIGKNKESQGFLHYNNTIAKDDVYEEIRTL